MGEFEHRVGEGDAGSFMAGYEVVEHFGGGGEDGWFQGWEVGLC